MARRGLGMGLMRRRDLPAITLGPLTLSVSTIAENSASNTVVGAIQGAKSGSTLSIQSQSNANWFAISGGNLVIGSSPPDYETNAAPTVTIRETLAGATNTPRDTVLTLTITDVAEGSPPAFVRSIGSSGTTNGSGNWAATLPAVDGASGMLLAVVSLGNVTAITCATAGWTKVDELSVGVFRAAIFIAPEGAGAPTFTSGASSAISARIAYYKGTAALAVAATVGARNSGTGTAHSAVDYNTSVNNALSVYADVTASASSTLSTPTNYTEDVDAQNAAPPNAIALGSRSLPTSGSAAGALSMTATQNVSWVLFNVQLS